MSDVLLSVDTVGDQVYVVHFTKTIAPLISFLQYFGLVLYSRKRYAAVKYESPNDVGKLDVKGIAVVRRDNAPVTKMALQDCLHAMLFERNTELALEIARKHVLAVMQPHQPSLDPFVVSKTLREGYKVDSLVSYTLIRIGW